MYHIKPNLLIGFHGCERKVAEALINSPENLEISRNRYDWLGHGFYFWENNPERAWQWCLWKQEKGLLNEPAVVGAVLTLDYCCDFLDSKFIDLLKTYYDLMRSYYDALEKPMPENRDPFKSDGRDKILRELDCAVIEFMHSEIYSQRNKEINENGYSELKPFDSARGVFVEGKEVYDGAGILEKSHIQICVRNPNCIKGFFLPRNEIDFELYLRHEDAKKDFDGIS